MNKIPKHPVYAIKQASLLTSGMAAARPMLQTAGNAIKGVGTTAVNALNQSSFGRNIVRTGTNLANYGKELATKPIQTLGKNLKAGGAAIDPEKRWDLLENSLNAGLSSGKKVQFSALNQADPNRGMIGKGVDWLRGQGILAAGRSTTGTVNKAQQASLQRYMQNRGLLHKTKAGDFVVNRNANVQDLEAAYKRFHGYKTTGDAGIIDKARNLTNYIPLPGERGLFLGGAGMAMAGQLGNKETADGRQRGLAERVARAGTIGLAETIAAPIGVANRLYGGLGMVGEQALTMGAQHLLDKNNKDPNKIPVQQPSMAAQSTTTPSVDNTPISMPKTANFSVYSNPRARLLRAIK